VNASVTGTDNEHGVRQIAPFEALATAPGGLESIVKIASVGGDSRLKLGMFDDIDEQLASAKPNITTTDARVFMSVLCIAEYHSRVRIEGFRLARGARE
jgi:hypothetical protein